MPAGREWRRAGVGVTVGSGVLEGVGGVDEGVSVGRNVNVGRGVAVSDSTTGRVGTAVAVFLPGKD